MEDNAEANATARPDVPMVRLMYGEVTEASIVLLLPFIKETDDIKAMDLAPRRNKTYVDVGIVEVEKGWTRWQWCGLGLRRGGSGRGGGDRASGRVDIRGREGAGRVQPRAGGGGRDIRVLEKGGRLLVEMVQN